MIYFLIYLIIATIWGIYAGYRQYQLSKNLYGKWLNVFEGFILNLILFPYCFFISIKNKKL